MSTIIITDVKAEVGASAGADSNIFLQSYGVIVLLGYVVVCNFGG